MSNPATWQLLEHVRDAIRRITPANGFTTEIGLGVVALEASQLPEEDTPSVLILARDIAIDEDKSTRSALASSMSVLIECTVPFAVHENPQLAAHRARADVLRALIPLRRDIKDRPRGVSDFSLIGSLIGEPEDGAACVIAQVVARASLTETISPANL